MTKKSNKKNIVKSVIIIALFALLCIFVGTYIAYRIIGSGFIESEIVTKQEDGKSLVQEEIQDYQSTVELKIFYTEDYKKLSPEIVIYSFTKDDKVSLASFIVKRLFSSPNSPNLHSLFPSDFKLRGVYLINKLLIVDIDPGALKVINVGVQMEMLMVYSLINSLAENIKEVESIQILINGEIKNTFLGHIDISNSLIPQINLL